MVHPVGIQIWEECWVRMLLLLVLGKKWPKKCEAPGRLEGEFLRVLLNRAEVGRVRLVPSA